MNENICSISFLCWLGFGDHIDEKADSTICYPLIHWGAQEREGVVNWGAMTKEDEPGGKLEAVGQWRSSLVDSTHIFFLK